MGKKRGRNEESQPKEQEDIISIEGIEKSFQEKWNMMEAALKKIKQTSEGRVALPNFVKRKIRLLGTHNKKSKNENRKPIDGTGSRKRDDMKIEKLLMKKKQVFDELCGINTLQVYQSTNERNKLFYMNLHALKTTKAMNIFNCEDIHNHDRDWERFVREEFDVCSAQTFCKKGKRARLQGRQKQPRDGADIICLIDMTTGAENTRLSSSCAFCIFIFIYKSIKCIFGFRLVYESIPTNKLQKSPENELIWQINILNTISRGVRHLNPGHPSRRRPAAVNNRCRHLRSLLHRTAEHRGYLPFRRERVATVSASSATIPPSSSSSSSFCRHLQPQHGSFRCCSDCHSPSFCPAAASRRRRSYGPPIRYPLLRSSYHPRRGRNQKQSDCGFCENDKTELTWLNAHLTKIWPYVDEAASEIDSITICIYLFIMEVNE
ncbi:unnamed protein product [Lactuca virosa]|uniref:Uncharacterized protein n=1 Tax=Lactuca virosa TaxID=75947 RepID=A0AAU9PB82_9ASTR|nr:unnamed protein product [Lactuca virosa]